MWRRLAIDVARSLCRCVSVTTISHAKMANGLKYHIGTNSHGTLANTIKWSTLRGYMACHYQKSFLYNRVIHGSLGPHKSVPPPKWHINFNHFCSTHKSWSKQTDRQTHRPCYVNIGIRVARCLEMNRTVRKSKRPPEKKSTHYRTMLSMIWL